MRADKGTLVTLNALVYIPLRNINSNTALLIGRSTYRECTISMGLHLSNCNLITLLAVNRILNLSNVIWQVMIFLYLSIHSGCPISRNIYQMQRIDTSINCAIVHINDILALLAIGSNNSILKITYSLLQRNNISQLEECGLHYHVETSAEAKVLSNLYCINGVELDIVLSNVALHRCRKIIGQLLIIPESIEKEGTVLLKACQQIILIYIRLLGAGYKVSIVNKVWRSDRRLTKTQMRHSNTARLLGVISEICLCIKISLITDNLDSGLVCTYGTIRSQAPELAGSGSLRSEVNLLWIKIQ